MNSHDMGIIVVAQIREEELSELISFCCISHLDMFFLSNGSLCSRALE